MRSSNVILLVAIALVALPPSVQQVPSTVYPESYLQKREYEFDLLHRRAMQTGDSRNVWDRTVSNVLCTGIHSLFNYVVDGFICQTCADMYLRRTHASVPSTKLMKDHSLPFCAKYIVMKAENPTSARTTLAFSTLCRE